VFIFRLTARARASPILMWVTTDANAKMNVFKIARLASWSPASCVKLPRPAKCGGVRRSQVKRLRPAAYRNGPPMNTRNSRHAGETNRYPERRPRAVTGPRRTTGPLAGSRAGGAVVLVIEDRSSSLAVP
jgi:hypothetical protein